MDKATRQIYLLLFRFNGWLRKGNCGKSKREDWSDHDRCRTTFPYGKDPKDSNIRIAPSFPTVEEVAQAAEIFVLSVKLVSVEKLLGAK